MVLSTDLPRSAAAYDDGRVELLLSLTGVLPVPVGANTYHCPVAIWLPLDFPSKPPIVYVLPSETLQIRKGKHVDANGKVAVPYLDNWERKSEVWLRFRSAPRAVLYIVLIEGLGAAGMLSDEPRSRAHSRLLGAVPSVPGPAQTQAAGGDSKQLGSRPATASA